MVTKQEILCKTYGLFTLLPHLLPLCSIKATSILTLRRWYLRTLVCPLLRCLGFSNKVVTFISIPHLPIIVLLCGKHTKLGLSNNLR